MNSISYLYDRPQVYTAVYLRRTAVKRTVYTLARGSARTESRVRHKFCYGKTPLSEPRLPTGSDLRFMAINIVQINKLDQHQNVVFLAIQRGLPPPGFPVHLSPHGSNRLSPIVPRTAVLHKAIPEPIRGRPGILPRPSSAHQSLRRCYSYNPKVLLPGQSMSHFLRFVPPLAPGSPSYFRPN
jgi:hypothetical protein